jgi:hypothetical protein
VRPWLNLQLQRKSYLAAGRKKREEMRKKTLKGKEDKMGIRKYIME